MKQYPILSLLAAILLTACNPFENSHTDTPIVDWYPVNVFITVHDSAGNDLLDPTREGAFVHGTVLTFLGQKYGVESNLNYASVSMAPTKAYLARMRGLLLNYGEVAYSETEKRTCYYLSFGEIDGAKDFDDDLLIKWPDGSEDVIHYYCADHKVEKQKDGTWLIDCKRSWQLNKQAATTPFRLVK